MRLRSTIVIVAMGCLVFGLAETQAHATPNFPAVVQSKLKLADAPDCTLCHAGAPGRGTVTTPFGETIRSRGAIAYDENALKTALDAISAEKKDSDKDGVPDVDELAASTDPNAAAGVTVIVPEYGCGVGRGHATSGSGWLVGVIALLLLARAARR